ncbi:HD domain-containing protein [Methanococcoides sp. SA1]|nr:HD domain-containing protein [Methanococcoides sp. SA1]
MGAQMYLDELNNDLNDVGVSRNLGFVRECGEELAKFPDDCFTLGHSARTKRNFVKAGAIYDLDPRRLVLSGWLHDVGKIVDPELYSFKGKFSREQHEKKREHVEHSYQITSPRLPFVARVIRHHHEDGQEDSYPGYSIRDVNEGDDQLARLYSQLLGICDTWDAEMTRKDRKDVGMKERIASFKNRNWRDPVMVDTLLKKGVLGLSE